MKKKLLVFGIILGDLFERGTLPGFLSRPISLSQS